MHINYGVLSLVSYEAYKKTTLSALAQTIEKLLTDLRMSSEVDDALREILTMLEMMRALAVQATNDTLTFQEREQIQIEFDGLKEEIDRIAGTIECK
jgi:flagellin